MYIQQKLLSENTQIIVADLQLSSLIIEILLLSFLIGLNESEVLIYCCCDQLTYEQNIIYLRYLQFPRLSSISRIMFVWPVSTSHICDLPKTPTVYWQLHSSKSSPKKHGPNGVVARCEIILAASERKRQKVYLGKCISVNFDHNLQC